MKRCIPRAPLTRPLLPHLRHDRAYSSEPSPKRRVPVLEYVQETLDKDTKDGAFKIDAENKVVDTAAGSLPVSPVMDPSWLKAVRRHKQPKEKPKGKLQGKEPEARFRKLLAKNVYAQMLAAPIRQCFISRTPLPKTFLQQFRPVLNPTTGKAWWMPGELATCPSAPPKEPLAAETPAEHNPPKPAQPSSDDEGRVTKPNARGAAIYVTSHYDLLGRDSLGPSRKELSKRLHGVKSVWREGMQDAVLGVMRDEIVHELRLVGLPERLRLGYLTPLTSLGDVKDVVERGCVLWWGEAVGVGGAPGRWATLDLEGVLYGAKVPVHNLRVLLGEEHLERLKSECAFFREHGMAMLRRRVTLKTQVKLWRLQGYISGENFRSDQGQGLIEETVEKAVEGKVESTAEGPVEETVKGPCAVEGTVEGGEESREVGDKSPPKAGPE